MSMPTPIDERYRLELIKHYFDQLEPRGVGKWVFHCPLCEANRPKNKYSQKKGGMFWIPKWKAWRFNCIRCSPSLVGIQAYLKQVNPMLAERYLQERLRQASG
jgi:hypothetical protein